MDFNEKEDMRYLQYATPPCNVPIYFEKLDSPLIRGEAELKSQQVRETYSKDSSSYFSDLCNSMKSACVQLYDTL